MSFFSRSFLTFGRFRQQALKPRGLEEFFENGVALPTKCEPTGRAWTAAELRHKSFDDLQKLWIVLLKERNLLATQREEIERNRIVNYDAEHKLRVIKCKKSMARIKTVLTERYLAQQEAQSQHKATAQPNQPVTASTTN